ncbi:VOC family protein [Streptomyces sp. NPDC090075]|uniref:VOC family protein n=1 Tax=Streptomyces sp. NPDC090075 TaxID=3365937 RepID=UPI0037FA3B79
MPNVSMHHTGITVSDIHASIAFYEALGFTRSFPEPAPVDEAWLGTVVGVENARLLLMFVSLGDHRIELLQYVDPEGEGARPLASNDVGSFHIALSVDDVSTEYERLRALGVEFLSKPVVVTGGPFEGLKAVYGKDPDGNAIELISGVEGRFPT